MRSFLRWARYRADIGTDLAAMRALGCKLVAIDRAQSLAAGQSKRVLAACERKTTVGRRDYAILLLLARLGLRAREVVRLTLEDLDWQAGLITVRGKGGRHSKMPVPLDVGQAIADYLRNARRQP